MEYKRHIFNEVLEYELSKRIKRNSEYSLRAFARKLKVSPSYLSNAIHQKINISLSRIEELSIPLGINSQEIQKLKINQILNRTYIDLKRIDQKLPLTKIDFIDKMNDLLEYQSKSPPTL